MPQEIHVFLTDTKTLSDDKLDSLCHRLPDAQRRKFFSLKSFKKQKEFVVGRTLLIRALKTIRPDIELPFILEKKFSAPKICGLDNIYLSISHSDNFVCCVVCERPVGIDIEYKKDRNNLFEKSHFFMNDKELAELAEIQSYEQQLHYFYEVWCLKEAIFKALDTEAQREVSLKSIQLSSSSIDNWSLYKNEIDNYQLSLAYHGKKCPVNITLVDLNLVAG